MLLPKTINNAPKIVVFVPNTKQSVILEVTFIHRSDMSFPNKWNQFVAPQPTSKVATSRRNYWKFAKRHRGNNMTTSINNPLIDQVPKIATIGPLWNGCISVRNHNLGANAPNPITQLQRTSADPVNTLAVPPCGPNTEQPKIKSKYFARLNNDLRELWQIETPLYNAYVPSTFVPSFSVNLSGSLFTEHRNTKTVNPSEVIIERADFPQRDSGALSSYIAPKTPPHIPDDHHSPPINCFSSFSHASPTFVISSITNNDTADNVDDTNQQLSIIRNESCNIIPKLSFYEHICLAVNSVCEASLNHLYPQNRTTMDTILQQFQRAEQQPSVDTMNECDWPFSPMTNHSTVIGDNIIVPAADQSFGTTLHNETDGGIITLHDEDESAIDEDRLF